MTYSNTTEQIVYDQLLRNSSLGTERNYSVVDSFESAQSNQPLNLVCSKRTETYPTRLTVSNFGESESPACSSSGMQEDLSELDKQYLLSTLLNAFKSNVEGAIDLQTSSIVAENRTPDFCFRQTFDFTASNEKTNVLPPLNTSKHSKDAYSFTENSKLIEDSLLMQERRVVIQKSDESFTDGGVVREDQWKRYRCSGCGHRSNWKWDINKHIKVAHPERTNISTITMNVEEARLTLPHYLDRLKNMRNRSSRFQTQRSSTGNETDVSDNISNCEDMHSSGEGYYRPFKCSLCGHRSNWKWDVKKHIKQMHGGIAEVVTLTLDEARKTIHQYKMHRRQGLLQQSSQVLQPKNSHDCPTGTNPLIEDGQDAAMFNADESPKLAVTIIHEEYPTLSKTLQDSLRKELESSRIDNSNKIVYHTSVPNRPKALTENSVDDQVVRTESAPFYRDVKPYRRKILARRSLKMPTLTPNPPPNPKKDECSPLRCSDKCNRGTNFLPTPTDESRATSLNTEKAFELAGLLERVLHLLQNTNFNTSLLVQKSNALQNESFSSQNKEVPTEEQMDEGEDISNRSNEENETNLSEESSNLVDLILQPQVQHLLNKLSVLFETARGKSMQTLTTSPQ